MEKSFYDLLNEFENRTDEAFTPAETREMAKAAGEYMKELEATVRKLSSAHAKNRRSVASTINDKFVEVIQFVRNARNDIETEYKRVIK